MKILKFRAENVKRLSVVEIKPDGRLVRITGPNQAGKSSVLDAIWWALSNARNIQTAPIRKGAKKARIRLDLGAENVECIVTRTFTRTETGFNTTLTVENEKGFKASSPQQMLNGFLDALSFDPLWFKRAPAKDQFDALKRFVPGVDFAAIKKAGSDDYAKRTDVNREKERHERLAAEIAVGDDVPLEPIDEAALITQLEEAGTHNATVEQRKANREAVERTVAANDTKIAELRAELEALETRTTELRKKLAEAGPLPEKIDTAALRAEIERVQQVNRLVAQRKVKEEHQRQAAAAGAEAQALTDAMDAREKAKREAIAKGKMPVEGITFGDDAVLYDGVPFDQASDAVQLRVSCAIGMASNAELRVMRIRDGSLLDSKSLELIAKMAEERDFQVWIESVDETGTVGFVMEDGHLKGVTPPPDEAADAPAIAAE